MGLFGFGKKKKNQETVKNIIASNPKEIEVKKEELKKEPALSKKVAPIKPTEKVATSKEQPKTAEKPIQSNNTATAKASVVQNTSSSVKTKQNTISNSASVKKDNTTVKTPVKMQDKVSDIIKNNTKEHQKPIKEEVKPLENNAYTGKFEINRSKDGKKFFFNLYASNKVGIATSQMYSSAQSALNGIKSVIANAGKAPIEDQSLKKYEELPYPKWEIYIDNGGKYRFRLNASNGSCVCHSQGYTTKNACKNGIDSIIRSSQNAEIDKTYIAGKDDK